MTAFMTMGATKMTGWLHILVLDLQEFHFHRMVEASDEAQEGVS